MKIFDDADKKKRPLLSNRFVREMRLDIIKVRVLL